MEKAPYNERLLVTVPIGWVICRYRTAVKIKTLYSLIFAVLSKAPGECVMRLEGNLWFCYWNHDMRANSTEPVMRMKVDSRRLLSNLKHPFLILKSASNEYVNKCNGPSILCCCAYRELSSTDSLKSDRWLCLVNTAARLLAAAKGIHLFRLSISS